jgi:aminobenzoyl-glutamate transport protein
MSNHPPATPVSGRPQGALGRFLAIVEKGGNALPHPATLFLLLALAVILLSAVAAAAGWSANHPTTGKPILPVSLLSVEGLHRILTSLVTNFTSFAPLGTVLVALLGIGVAEGAGLVTAAMRLLVNLAPPKLLTPTIVFAGVMSNVASELGYVLLIPLAASIFAAAGKHPLAGLAAAFAGVSGGYSANLLLGTVDPLLSGLTQEAARLVRPDAKVNPACNYWFMAASTFLVTALGTWTTEKLVVPRLKPWTPEGGTSGGAETTSRPLDAAERRGLTFAGLAAAALSAIVLTGTVPERGFLRDPATGDLLHSPFMSGIVAIIFLFGLVGGVAYGVGAKTVKSDSDVIKAMSSSMSTLGGYLVLVFFAAQFVAFFNWTNLGLILGVKGAEALKSAGLGGSSLLAAFVLLTAVFNLFMGSASAKWALMAPIFVPMFLLLGYDPAAVQCAFRIGDSCTNVISPMMSYFALIIAFMQRYDRSSGLGTLVATMLPYSGVFLVGWTLFFVVWTAAGLPLGFG